MEHKVEKKGNELKLRVKDFSKKDSIEIEIEGDLNVDGEKNVKNVHIDLRHFVGIKFMLGIRCEKDKEQGVYRVISKDGKTRLEH
ncbi:hypothetical protein GF352_01270 [archaeon]|nr:hypothetical protein [archaeon]